MPATVRNQCRLLVAFFAAVVSLALASESAPPAVYLNAQLPWHLAVLDKFGKVLAWYHPEKNLGYDEFLRLDWDFLEHKVPIDPQTGVKIYLTAPLFDENVRRGSGGQHNPASTFAHQMDALLGWYPYSGDDQAIEVLRLMLDYDLAHGMTPADWEWAEVPFATSCMGDKDYGHCLIDLPEAAYGAIETDKIGELGLSFVQFYELTGERKYLEAGIHCAAQLAKHIRDGDANHTPWPFRIDAHSGAVVSGEEFGGMIVAPVRLFDELISIGEGEPAAFKTARDIAWQWILKNPLNKQSEAWDKWSGYYEDVPKLTANVNDMSSMMTAYYILTQENPAAVDPDWQVHVGHLLDRSRVLLGRGPFFGAWAIDEQLRPDGGITGAASPEVDFRPHGSGALLGVDNRGCCGRAGLVCRTSQWGAINALYFEKTRDGQARENAFRALNYATYFAESDGKIHCCGLRRLNPYWFEDGYGDAGRNFVWAMGAVPEFAPVGENHLLRSSSVVQKVMYGHDSVTYQTFHKAATEVLRLNFRPAVLMAGGAPLTAHAENTSLEGYSIRRLAGGGDYEVRLRHVHSNQITIKKG